MSDIKNEVILKVQQLSKINFVDSIHSTLIICTFNRPNTLLNNLKVLTSLVDLPKEILIVDGSINKDTFILVKEYLSKHIINANLYYVYGPTGLTKQRNAGIAIAKGKVIHFLDDDCYPEKDYFKSIESLFEKQKDVGAITGNILNEFNIKPGFKYKLRCLLGIFRKNYKTGIYYCNGSSVPKGVNGPIFNDFEVDILSGASMSFRKDILLKAGLFSNFFSGYSQGEDLEASLRVGKLAKIIQSHEAMCNHYQEPSSRPNLYKKGFMEVYNRHYIWSMNVKIKRCTCKLQFWGDILFLHFFAIILFFFKGFNISYLSYFAGLFKGVLFSIFRTDTKNEFNLNSTYIIQDFEY
jgi:GT2 family glycosyltransferase